MLRGLPAHTQRQAGVTMDTSVMSTGAVFDNFGLLIIYIPTSTVPPPPLIKWLFLKVRHAFKGRCM